MIPQLQAELRQVAARVAEHRWRARLAIFWTAVAGALLALVGGQALGLAVGLPALLLLVLAGAARLILERRRPRPDLREVARAVEHAQPELQTALLAALDQTPVDGQFTHLQRRVIRAAVESARGGRWRHVVPERDYRNRRWLARAAVALAGFAFTFLLSRTVMDGVETQRIAEALTVEPGTTEIERGSPVTITARFDRELPPSAHLEVTDAAGVTRTIPLTRTLEDPIFTAALPAVRDDLRYRVNFGQGTSPEFTVRVFDPPKVERTTARLDFPDYTGRPPATLENPRTVAAVEQSQLSLEITTNAPMRRVELRSRDQRPIPLAADPADPTRFRADVPLTQSAEYDLALVDESGRENARAETLHVKVTPNRPPVVKARMPGRGDRVTPLQETPFHVEVEDDFGLEAAGLTIQVGDRPAVEMPATIPEPGSRTTRIEHTIQLEDLNPRPNELIVWSAWGEDRGPDGKLRRTDGELHVTRVRAFDEVTRQMEGAGGGPPGEDECLKCIRIQTQILTGAWNVQRGSRAEPDRAEMDTLVTSQKTALDLIRSVEARFTSAEKKADAGAAITHMERARGHFESGKRADLPPAIEAAQSALRHLYRLVSNERLLALAKEGEASESESDGDREDLELKNMKPRYETETQAQAALTAEDRAIREALNRLRDLAQRQRDLNEEINRLQHALRLAQTDAARAEAERQLARLREKQRELQAEMERAAQQMAASGEEGAPERQQQLADAAQSAARAATKLDQGKLGEALAEAERAQREVNRAQQSLRESAAGQLSDQLRGLREQARELAERQRELGRELEDSTRPLNRRTLRDDPDSFDARAAAQAEALQQLLAEAENTARQVEETEPLVSRGLGEAVRESGAATSNEAIEQMRAAAAVEDREGARSAHQSAQRGADALREGIERATAKVLGSEEEALRFAQAEITKLREQAGGASPGTKPGEGSPLRSAPPGSNPAESPGGDGTEPRAGTRGEAGTGRGEPEGTTPSPAGQQASAEGQASGEGQGQSGGQSPSRSPGSSGAQASPTERASSSQGESGNGRSAQSPIFGTAEEFLAWSERLQDLQATVEMPQTRDAIARALGAARDLRRDAKRHAALPGQDLVVSQVLNPLAEAEEQIRQALGAIDRKNPLAPVERDPVPEKFTDLVRRYYESLGE